MGKKQQTEKTDLETKLDSLEKKYGLGKSTYDKLKIVSTGSIQLNQAMKTGGTALGKMIEIFGGEGSGKTTIMLHQLAEYQKAFPDKKVALFDYEHSFSPDYAAIIGLNLDNLLFYQPDTQEQGYDMILGLVTNEMISCVVVDSQTAAAPKAVIDGEMDDSTIGLQARLNSKFCLKIKGLLDIHDVTLFFVSQTRDKIGGYGDGTATTGGNAIKFYSDIRWKVWKTSKRDDELNITSIEVIKSKIGNPFGKAEVNLLWGVGFDKVGEIMDYAIKFDIMKRGGSWYSYGESKLGQGEINVKNLLADNPELLEEITEKVMNVLKNEKVPKIICE